MEFFFLFVIICMLIWYRMATVSALRNLANEVETLREQVGALLRRHGPPPAAASPVPKPQETREEEKPRPVTPPPPAEKPAIVPAVEIPKTVPAPVFRMPEPPPPPPRPSFFERHPDLEKFIGENLINKIGIAILVLGIGFFVKYAIDKDWIHEAGRAAIGILAGGLLIGIAHRLRNTFKAFSSVLVGGGLAVLYFTIAIAFHQYHLFGPGATGQATAFVIMVVITAFAVALSIGYDRMELAVLAIIGGFSTPFMVSTGEGNYKVLFTYLLILNSGMLVLAFWKKWKLVNILCYVFTILLYGSWLLMKCLDMPGAPYAGALLFATAFYLVFFLMNILYHLRRNIPFHAFETGMLLSNTALYYAAGMGILHYYYTGTYQGLFTVLLGLFNFGFAFALYRKQSVDRNLVYLLIGLVLTFISLAAPVQLEGNHITLFWAAEALLLLWFSQKTRILMIRSTSLLVMLLMIVSLLMDWQALYGPGQEQKLAVLVNKAFLTSLGCLVSLFLSGMLLAKEQVLFFAGKLPAGAVRQVVQVLFVAILYGTGFLEVRHQLQWSFESPYEASIGIGLYNFLFLCTGYLLYRKKLTQPMAMVFAITAALCLFTYFVQYNFAIIGVRNEFLEGGSGLFYFLHYPQALLFAAGIFIFYRSVHLARGMQPGMAWVKWIAVFLVVYICSAELHHIGTWIVYHPGRMVYYINKQIAKTGYSVLWGIISFLLMQQGMKRKDRTLRVISLSLFFLTILKLFAWDIRGISDAGKIIAFISLGIILLTVSFMYQRLKKLILESDVPMDQKS